MSDQVTEADFRRLRALFEKTGGKAWEPPEPDHPWLVRMVAAGFLERCDMRCGFEAFRNSGVRWTAAGKVAIDTQLAIDAELVVDWIGTSAGLEEMQRIAITIRQRCAEIGGKIEGMSIQ